MFGGTCSMPSAERMWLQTTQMQSPTYAGKLYR